MSAEWAELIAWYGVPVLLLAAGWFARAVWEQPHRNATEQALEQARSELRTLTAHTMARHKARSEAAVRGHVTRRGRGNAKAVEWVERPGGGLEAQP